MEIQKSLQLPCVRPAILSGMASGFVFGLMTYLHRGNIKRSCNVAVGSFLIFSCIGIPFCLQFRSMNRKRIRIDEKSATVEQVLQDKPTN